MIVTKAEGHAEGPAEGESPKASAQSLLNWNPSKKISGSREKVYVAPVRPQTPKPVAPLKNLPRYIVKAKREGIRPYTSGKRFCRDMLEVLLNELGRPVERVDDHDMYQSVFVGFIAHLSTEDVRELLHQPEVDEVEQVGAKQSKSASKRPVSAEDGSGAKSRPLSRNAWSRTLGVKGEKSTAQFAWFAPSAEKRWPSLADQIGSDKVVAGRDTYIDSASRVGVGTDKRDAARARRLRAERSYRQQLAADRRAGYRELPVVMSESAGSNLTMMEGRALPPTEAELLERRALRAKLMETRAMLAEATGRLPGNVPMKEVDEYLLQREAADRAKFK